MWNAQNQMPKTRRDSRGKKKPPKFDGRGKHTKESRKQKALELQRFFALLDVHISCANCGGDNFAPTQDLDSSTCTSCGLVTNERNIEGITDCRLDVHSSVLYSHRNYLAERIQQARALEPPFTTSQQNKISVLWHYIYDKARDAARGTENGFGTNPFDWSLSERSFSKYRFRQICGLLDQLEPGRRWKQKLEKWWQARAIIYGEDRTWNVLDDYHAQAVKILFDPIGARFDQAHRKKEPGKHNIPKLDIIILVLLYNISEETLEKYGWYFLSNNIVHPTASTLSDYDRVKTLLTDINQNFLQGKTQKGVRRESYAWLQKHKYQFPENLETLVAMASASNEGQTTLLHLYYHNHPIFDKQILLVDSQQ